MVDKPINTTPALCTDQSKEEFENITKVSEAYTGIIIRILIATIYCALVQATTYSLSIGRLRVKFALAERGCAVTPHL